MTEFVTSADGTRIAFDRRGEGPCVIFISGAMEFRAFDSGTAELATRMAARGFTAVSYDRRGRGESEDRQPYDVDREVDDIAALMEANGGSAALFGTSSGAVLALWAAAAGLPVTALALWEPPLAVEDSGEAAEYERELSQRAAAGDREGTIALFMRDMPPEWFESAKAGPAWPQMLAVSPSLTYDAALLARAQAGEPWAKQWSAVTQPTTVLTGTQTLPLFPPAADALEKALPDARHVTIAGANHSWDIDALVAALVPALVLG
jgi:pimeloyl-ACP methyl ester carboxylesterase